MVETQFDSETFQREALAHREAKRAELAAAVAELETAAWTRDFWRVKKARERIVELTGISITAPTMRELQKAVRERVHMTRI